MKQIREQYEKWIYPEPVQDMVTAIQNGYAERFDIPLFGNMLWHDKQSFDGLEILVAGCGTNSAAYNAIRNPNCNITGIDISESSLDHERYLASKHQIKNIELRNVPIEKVQSVGKKFDFILCSGVLHHLDDPLLGLKSLVSVLNDNGMMSLMLYGETFRQGVYLLQKAFKELGLKQNEEDISIAREIIRALPERHSVMPYIRYAHELAYDAAFVDTFLNPVDRAYSVEGIFDLLDRAELEFISWQDPLVYDHRAYFQNLESLSKLLINKSDRERYAIVEKLTYARGAHYFNVCKKNFALLRVKPDVSKSFENVYPKVRAGIKAIKPATKISGGNAVLQRSFIRFEISFKQAQVLQMCNGENTVGEISNALNVPLQELDIFIKDMYSFGHLLIRC